MSDREVTCKKCEVTNVGSTVYQAMFDLKHKTGCSRLTAEYDFRNREGEVMLTGTMNAAGKMS